MWNKILLFQLIEKSLGGHIFQTSVENVPNSGDVQKVYQVKWFNQTLDHFTFTTSKKFPQKYLVNDTFWNRFEEKINFQIRSLKIFAEQ